MMKKLTAILLALCLLLAAVPALGEDFSGTWYMVLADVTAGHFELNADGTATAEMPGQEETFTGSWTADDASVTITIDGSPLTFAWDGEKLFSDKLPIPVVREAGRVPMDLIQKYMGGEEYELPEGMDEEVYRLIPERALYERTGIQKQMFNTIYQLMSVKQKTPELLEKAESFLMLPDYFHFLLTGVKKQEYTNATSSQLVNAETCEWDMDLIRLLGYPEKLFGPLSMPGTPVGPLRPEIAKEVGFNCNVVLPATHDTGAAVMAVPADGDDTLYISSGTWSLMGVESLTPNSSETAQAGNFTNEGGYDHRYRILKNIMGLWMIQSVRQELDCRYSFAELCEMAEAERAFPSRVDVNDQVFLAPENMQEAIREYVRKKGGLVPETPGQMATVIYQSLAESYAETLKQIEDLTGKSYDCIYVIGGGANAMYLNKLTAEKTGRTVMAGPGEATAIGNLMAQMIQAGEFASLSEARRCVRESFDIAVVRA